MCLKRLNGKCGSRIIGKASRFEACLVTRITSITGWEAASGHGCERGGWARQAREEKRPEKEGLSNRQLRIGRTKTYLTRTTDAAVDEGPWEGSAVYVAGDCKTSVERVVSM